MAKSLKNIQLSSDVYIASEVDSLVKYTLSAARIQEADSHSLSIDDRYMYDLSVAGNKLSIYFPPCVENKARDFNILVNYEGGTPPETELNILFKSTDDETYEFYSDDIDVFSSIGKDDKSLFSFTEISENKFMVSQKFLQREVQEEDE